MLLVVPCLGVADILLNEGESFIFSFTQEDLIYQYDVPPFPPIIEPWSKGTPDNMLWGFGEYIDESHRLLVEVYEEPDSTSLLLSRTYVTTNFILLLEPSLDQYYYKENSSILPDFWGGGSGSIRFQSLEGATRLSTISVGSVVDGKYYSATIPEPTSISLLFIGAGGIWMLRKRLRR